jgi:hypothetical protein
MVEKETMMVSNLYILFTSLNDLRSALLEANMKCELCKKVANGRLCNTCWNFLKWNYPQDDPEDILDQYKEAYVRNYYLQGRKRK